jgi:hypothetical protein
MELRVKIDTRNLTAALLKAPEIVRPILRRRMGTEMNAVARYARANHRFTSRAGKLEQSITTEVSSGGLQGCVYLKGGMAPYGEYIHEGTGRYGTRGTDFYVAPVTAKALHWGKFFSKGHLIKGWRPDRFLTESLKVNRQHIIDGLVDAYTTALQKAGLI